MIEVALSFAAINLQNTVFLAEATIFISITKKPALNEKNGLINQLFKR